ncbi:hypothetical protein Tco_1045752 [Tanacetum coccineum]|uniref:Uncharacterized protein n=1 Tax=Tanacetum coccineum TaxID=301880 RepID=A0ABQ5GVV6_9ASTR
MIIPSNQVSHVRQTDNFSLHDVEELSLHDDESLTSDLKPIGNSKKRVPKARMVLYRVIPPSTQTRTDAKEIWAVALQDKIWWKCELEENAKALDALGVVCQDEDANHRFFEVLPPAIQKTSSSSLIIDNVAFLSQACSSSKHKPSHNSGSYSSYTTSSSKATPTATPGLADEVIHSFLATNADDVDLIHEDLDQIDDLDLEESDIVEFSVEYGKIWTQPQTPRVNKANQFTPRPVQLSNIRPNFSTASRTIKTGRVNVNTGKQNVSSGSKHVNAGNVHFKSGTQFKSGDSRFNTGKQTCYSVECYVNSGTPKYVWQNGYCCYDLEGPLGRPKPVEGMGPFEDYPKKLSKVGSDTFGGRKREVVVSVIFDNKLIKAFRVYNLVTKRVEVNLHVNFLEEKPNVQGLGHRWMFDLDYLTDSMNYIPVSLQNQANHAGSKEVIDIDVQTEGAEELLVVSSTSRPAAGSEPTATKKSLSSKNPSSTPISKSADDIMIFRKELDALALKHLGPVPTSVPTKEVFSDDNEDEMPEIRIYDKSSEGIFEQASYDDDGVITDFNNLPDEFEPRKVTEALEDGSWVEAMQEELLQFKLQQVWVLVDLPTW